jgi:hypothetical protein
MKTLILFALVALNLGVATIGGNARPQRYQAPPHNYYQNNWMNGRD